MTQTLEDTILQERQSNRHLLLILSISMLAIVLIVSIGVGIIVYNSINNAPKIQCIYDFSKTGVNDIHHLLNKDANPHDYPMVKCNG